MRAVVVSGRARDRAGYRPIEGGVSRGWHIDPPGPAEMRWSSPGSWNRSASRRGADAQTLSPDRGNATSNYSPPRSTGGKQDVPRRPESSLTADERDAPESQDIPRATEIARDRRKTLNPPIRVRFAVGPRKNLEIWHFRDRAADALRSSSPSIRRDPLTFALQSPTRRLSRLTAPTLIARNCPPAGAPTGGTHVTTAVTEGPKGVGDR